MHFAATDEFWIGSADMMHRNPTVVGGDGRQGPLIDGRPRRGIRVGDGSVDPVLELGSDGSWTVCRVTADRFATTRCG